MDLFSVSAYGKLLTGEWQRERETLLETERLRVERLKHQVGHVGVNHSVYPKYSVIDMMCLTFFGRYALKGCFGDLWDH